jgi:hypothetical protein
MASHRELAMGLDHIRSEIEHMRLQVARQKKNPAATKSGHTDHLG